VSPSALVHDRAGAFNRGGDMRKAASASVGVAENQISGNAPNAVGQFWKLSFASGTRF
jgi:hypothetical protein